MCKISIGKHFKADLLLALYIITVLQCFLSELMKILHLQRLKWEAPWAMDSAYVFYAIMVFMRISVDTSAVFRRLHSGWWNLSSLCATQQVFSLLLNISGMNILDSHFLSFTGIVNTLFTKQISEIGEWRMINQHTLNRDSDKKDLAPKIKIENYSYSPFVIH